MWLSKRAESVSFALMGWGPQLRADKDLVISGLSKPQTPNSKWEWKESRILVLLIGEAYRVGTVRGSFFNLSNHNYTKSIFREERESGLFSTETIALWGNVVKIYDMSFHPIYCTSKQNIIDFFLCFLWQWVLIHPSSQLKSEVKMHILPSSWLLCGIIWL